MTKTIRNIFIIGVGLLLFSCEPQSLSIEDSEQYSRVFMQSAGDISIEKTYDITDEWHQLAFGAGYGGFNQLTENLVITFEVQPELVEPFNTQNGTNYEIAPENSYRLVQNTVTIPVGKTGSNSTRLEVNPLHFGGTRPVLIPVSIQSTTGSVRIEESKRTTYYVVSGGYVTNPYTPYAKNDWEIHDFSSEEDVNDEGPAWKAIDGDINTNWLTKWRRDANNQRPVHPHHVSIDMGVSQTMHGVQLFGRLGTNPTNMNHNFYLFPRLVNVEVSEDGSVWESAGIYSTALEPTPTPEFTIYFEQSVKGRYFRITVVNSHSNNGDTSAIAEIEAF
ncbi:BT_3987 domain-containing protein [Sphingobacterium haloxyli]|uniref:F5/8 type C domain-containing protein n=1 Tax=Sphingobacterium haloxyli TaxID=2100533 RepID=A0A2S9J4E6_9SPHI|nr:DUF1735 domain-containing protein [Sphingobacterium haloxyli]PRD47663.1 hypothetical protein C5745_10175 [Sphingobacterium haloxyli]